MPHQSKRVRTESPDKITKGVMASSPITGELIAQVRITSPEEVSTVIDRASQAFASRSLRDAGADWSGYANLCTDLRLDFRGPCCPRNQRTESCAKVGLTRQEYMRRKSLGARYCASETTFCYQRIMETGKVDTTVSPDQDDPGAYGSSIK